MISLALVLLASCLENAAADFGTFLSTDLTAAPLDSLAPLRALVEANESLLDAAFEGWKKETTCDRILTDESRNFYRVWMFAGTCGCLLFMAVTLPMIFNSGGLEGFISDLAGEEQDYEVSNDELKSTEKGVKYCSVMGVDEKDGSIAEFGTMVKGQPVGDGSIWIKVDSKFLPTCIDDKRVLIGKSRAARKQKKKKIADAAQTLTGDARAPDLDKAMEHLLRTSPTDVHGKMRSVWGTNMSILSEVGGIGTELYFKLLRNLGVCFTYIMVCTSPLAMLSSFGDFMPDAGVATAKTSIGNLGMMAVGGLQQRYRVILIGCQAKDLSSFTSIFSWMDLLGVVIYMSLLAWFVFWYLPRAVKKDEDDTLSCMDFAVEIDGIPRTVENQKDYVEHLKEHLETTIAEAFFQLQSRRDFSSVHWVDRLGGKDFSAKGVVREVVLVRDWKGRLGSVIQTAEMKKLQDIADYKGVEATTGFLCRKKPLKDIIAKEQEKLDEKLGDVDELHVLRAYVILNTTHAKRFLMNIYRLAQFRVLRCCQRRALRFKGIHAVRVRDAPEPTDILWVNQDVPDWKRRIFIVVMSSSWFLMMVIAIALIYSTSSASQAAGAGLGQQVIGDPQCDTGTKTSANYKCSALVAVEWTKAYGQTLSGDQLACYCTTQGYTKILQDKDLYDGTCKDWLVGAGTTVALGVLASVIVVVINNVLRIAIMKFAMWERPTSLSQLNSSIMVKVAVSQYLNIAVIIYLVNFNFSYDGTQLFGGAFSDFDRGWFAVVGATLLSNMLVNSFMGIATLGGYVTIVFKRCCCRGKVKHQQELLDLYTNPTFNIAERYAQMLTTCFCCMTYSSGLPLLNLFAAMYCFISYWSDKVALLRGSRQPPAYDGQMPKEAGFMLLWAGPLHILVSIFMFSHPCTFPSKPIGGDIASLQASASSLSGNSTLSTADAADASNSLSNRLSLESTWMMTFALGLVLAFFALYVALKIIGGSFGLLWKFMKVLFCSKLRRVAPAGEEGDVGEAAVAVAKELQDWTWDEAKMHIEKCRPPASYEMLEHEDIKPIKQFIESSPSATSIVPTAAVVVIP